MKLTRYEFGEHEDSSRRWTVNSFLVDPVSLFVGRNGSGKSRLLNSIGALAGMLAGKREGAWPSGHWSVALQNDGETYRYDLRISEGRVALEQLHVNEQILIERTITGDGEMLSQEAGKNLRFRIPGNRLAASRTDEIQYPYLVPLLNWAQDIKKYTFGSEFGRTMLFAANPDLDDNTPVDMNSVANGENVVLTYFNGYRNFKSPFDLAILDDFREVGYDCEDVFVAPIDLGPDIPNEITGKIPLALGVKEKDLMGPTRQVEMSNGMFRALAIIIHIQYLIFSGHKSTVLVDDIGEGLDYARSTALIKLLIRRCQESGIQLLMTSNDRFVMNEVDLRYWHVVQRSGHDVSILDYENSKDIFDRFTFLGLSNFDFFSREAYLGWGK